MRFERKVLLLAAALTVGATTEVAVAPLSQGPGVPMLLVAGLEGGSGSTIGPGGALFVTEGAAGRVSRVDPKSGAITTFASGLPQSIVGIGGAMDVAFIGSTAYVLVTLVGSDVGGADTVGIYRVDGPSSFTVIADIGEFALLNPPATDFFVPTGVQYSLEAWRGGLLVSDGHHNRVLRVTLDGEITELIAFGNTVPTGLATTGNTIYVAMAGPVPHLPEDGRVVAFGPKASTATEIASGARLVVDVELGPGRTLFALSQGIWDGVAEGSPAMPNTGALVQVAANNTFTVITEGLDRPTSLEILGNTAYIVTLGGEIWTIDGVATPPYGNAR
jgi:sugar lactone lactonase YvrE